MGDKLARRLVLLSTLIISIRSITLAHRDGSPLTSCNTMVPNPSHLHGHGAEPSRHPSPYSILVSNLRRHEVAEYAPGGKQVLKVRIQGPKYRGYLLQAQSMSSHRRVGEFLTPLPIESKFLHCDVDHPQSVVTHSCSAHKQHQTFFWRPPESDVGPIYFVATIVGENRTSYWTLIQSPPLFPSPKTIASEFVSIDTNRCGKGFGCFRMGSTSKCLSSSSLVDIDHHSSNTCNLTLSWQCSKTFVVFEMLVVRDHRHLGATGGTYAALVLSKDVNMHNAELLVCELRRHPPNASHPHRSYKAQPVAYHYHYTSTSLRPLRDSIHELKTTVLDERLFYCRFSRPLNQDESPTGIGDFESSLRAYVAFGKIYGDGHLQSPSTTSLTPVFDGTMCSHPDIYVPLPVHMSLVSSVSPKPAASIWLLIFILVYTYAY